MRLEGEVIAIGAESSITKVEIWGKHYALKQRPSKPYLIPEIDSMLRATRTSRECKSLVVARTLGVPTPAVHAVDLGDYSILMDYINGKQLNNLLTRSA